MEAEERDRMAEEHGIAQRERETEARSAGVAEKARMEQHDRSLAQLLQEQQQALNAAQAAKSERVEIGRLWAREKHARYAESHPTSSRTLDGEYIQLGWEQMQGGATCDFCDETTRFYHSRCPLGDSIACQNCRNSMSVALHPC